MSPVSAVSVFIARTASQSTLASMSMLNKRTLLHLTTFFLASIASLPAHVSAVLEKGGTQAGEIPGNPDDGEGILDYIVRFTDAESYQNFVKTEVQLMNAGTSLSFMNTQVLNFSSEEDAEAWFAERKDVQLFAKGESSQSRKTSLSCDVVYIFMVVSNLTFVLIPPLL